MGPIQTPKKLLKTKLKNKTVFLKYVDYYNKKTLFLG